MSSEDADKAESTMKELADEFLEAADKKRTDAREATDDKMKRVHHTAADTWESAAHRLQAEIYDGERA